MAKKKVSRKELLKQEDEFITLSQRMISFLVDHKKQFITGFSIFFSVLILIAGIRYFSEKAERTSFLLLSQVLGAYEEKKAETDPKEALAAVEADFQKLLKKYSGKEGAAMGRVFLGGIYLEAQEPKKALAVYEQALEDFDPQDPIHYRIVSAMGYAREADGDLAGAATDFQKVADAVPALSKDLALFNLGRIYEALGDKEKSLAAFKKLVSDYQDSLYIEVAREKVSLAAG